MNNSQIVFESLNEDSPNKEAESILRAEESRIIKIIEAIREIQGHKAWETLRTELFENLANRLEKELLNEAKREEINEWKLNRLAGELTWAERYADLNKLENTYKVHLQNIRIKLYGKQE